MFEYNLGLYEKSMPNFLSLREKLAETKAAGFDFMEISIDETDEKLARLKWDNNKCTSVLKSMFETETRIFTMCLSGHRKYPLGSENSETRAKGVEIMIDAIDLARNLGIRIIQIAGYDEYYLPSTEETARLFTENLIKLTEYAAKNGVILAFETMETEFMNTVKKAMHFVNKVNSPFLQVYPDIGNIYNSALSMGNDPLEDLALGRGHIAAMHMKETVPGKFREIPFGEGHVDFMKALNTAKSMGVFLFVGEFWYVGNDMWKDDLKAANIFLRNRMTESETGSINE